MLTVVTIRHRFLSATTIKSWQTSLGRRIQLIDLNDLSERKSQRNQPISKANRINCREFGRSMSRGSNSSQLTLMTSINKSVNEGNNNVTATCANVCLLKTPRPPRAVGFGNLLLSLRNINCEI